MHRGAVRRGNAPPVFTSRVVDNVVHIHPVTAVLLFSPVLVGGVALSIGRAGPGALIGWAAAGYVAWTLFEYWGHRLLFHFEPERGIGATFHLLVHGLHHDYPTDLRRSIMSPLLSVPAVTGVVGVSCGLLGTPPTFAAGFVAGYLCYDLLHIYLHRARPRNRLVKRIQELHMRHHFRDDTRGFGVSAPYWDPVFGTSATRSRRGSLDSG